VIGQGTWRIDSGDRRDAVTALRRGLDLGLWHVDTAEMYGEAELIVGEAIAGRRDNVFLVSKVLPSHAARDQVVSACERSLSRLSVERLDAYLLHWRGSTPLEETVGAFVEMQRQGKIAHWGVSNFDVDDLDDLSALGLGAPACNQVLYHLEERAIEHAVLPWCEANGVAVVAYSPFGSGRFVRPDSSGGRVLAEVAHARGATARQVALAFLTRRPSLLAIPKAAKPAHVEDNAAAGEIELTAQEIAALEAAFPLGARPRGLPMI
jgi:diketogulonate reductase-like aldo/keto reductase